MENSRELEMHYMKYGMDNFGETLRGILSSYSQYYVDNHGDIDEKKCVEAWLGEELSIHGIDVDSSMTDELLSVCKQLKQWEEVVATAIKDGKDVTLWLYSQLRPDINKTDDENYGCPMNMQNLWELYRQCLIARDIMSGSFHIVNTLPKDVTYGNNKETNERLVADLQGKRHNSNNVQQTLLEQQFKDSVQKMLIQQYHRMNQLDASYTLASNSMGICAIDDIAYSLSKNSMIMGAGSLALSVGLCLGKNYIKSKCRGAEFNGITVEMLRPEVKNGLRMAIFGALKVGAARNYLPVAAGMASAGALFGMATIGVECCDVMFQYSQNEIDAWQAVDQVGRASTTGICSMTLGVQGAILGAAAATGVISCIPLVTPVLVGELVGGGAGIVVGGIVGREAYMHLRKLAVLSCERAREYINIETLREMPKVMVSNVHHEVQKLYNA